MSEWRSACVIAPYPPELLPKTPRRPVPPHLNRCSIAGSNSCSRKSSQAPTEAELMYWLPPSRVKQSGKATTTGDMRCSPISRSSRSGTFSRKPTQFVWDRPLLVKPTRSTSRGNPCPSCPAGRYTSTTRTGESSSILLVRAWLSIVTRLIEPLDPKNLRMRYLYFCLILLTNKGGRRSLKKVRIEFLRGFRNLRRDAAALHGYPRYRDRGALSIHALQVDPTWGAAHNFRTKAESQPRRTDRLSSFRSPSLSLAG